MSKIKHTPTPWKVVSEPHFDNGLVYTSIQPVNIDEETMKPLAMANGEYHVCRMSHSAAPWRFDHHRADAAFIVTAVNSFASLQEENEALKAALERILCMHDGNPPLPLADIPEIDYARRTISNIHREARAALQGGQGNGRI